MRNISVENVLTGTDMSADIKGIVVDISSINNVALHLAWTGTPTGTFRFQVSNDAVGPGISRSALSYDDLTWIDVDTQAGGAGAGSKLFTLTNSGAKWVTVFWDDTSGTGTVTVNTLHAKG